MGYSKFFSIGALILTILHWILVYSVVQYTHVRRIASYSPLLKVQASEVFRLRAASACEGHSVCLRLNPNPKPRSLSLGLQIAQSRYYL